MYKGGLAYLCEWWQTSTVATRTRTRTRSSSSDSNSNSNGNGNSNSNSNSRRYEGSAAAIKVLASIFSQQRGHDEGSAVERERDTRDRHQNGQECPGFQILGSEASVT